MAVPKYYEFYNAMLEALSDGKVYYYRDCHDKVKDIMKLTPEMLEETIPSGSPKWINRVGWCVVYLKKAGLIFNPKRAHLQITEAGKKLLAENVQITDTLLIDRFPSYAAFVNPKLKTSVNAETPQDTFDDSYDKINNLLFDELSSAIMSTSPKFFEKLVFNLMESIGYVKENSQVEDSNIDGIIYSDKLGFDRIGVQAKHVDSTVSDLMVYKFIGALQSQSLNKGLFVTSSKFSTSAKELAGKNNIKLIDGKKLIELMIEFDVGVSTQKIYKIKHVDNDFFSEE